MKYSKDVAKKRSLNKTTTQKPYWPKYHDSWSMSLCPRKNGWKTRYISWFQDMKCRYQTPWARDAKKTISNLKVCIYYSYCMFYTVVHVIVDLEREGFWLRFSRKRNFSWKLTHESAICLFRLNFKQRLVWLIRNLQWPSVNSYDTRSDSYCMSLVQYHMNQHKVTGGFVWNSAERSNYPKFTRKFAFSAEF